jgi:membrane protein
VPYPDEAGPCERPVGTRRSAKAGRWACLAVGMGYGSGHDCHVMRARCRRQVAVWLRSDGVQIRSGVTESGVIAMASQRGESVTRTQGPAAPEGPTELTARSWWHVAKRTVREFSRDDCTDQAAALTYYAVLSIFPAAIALVSLIGIFGQGRETTNALLDIVSDIGPQSAVDTLEGPLGDLSTAPGAGIALLVGVLLALWSASGYVGAFGRAMNRIYEVPEGRPFWKLRPTMIAVTLIAVLLVAVVAIGLVVTGPLAESVGRTIGLGDTAVTAWDIAKWPVLLAIVVAVVAILYYATPNVKQPKFRWISVGALIAIVTWALASVAFGLYVANFATYSKTYGSLAGVVVFLLWLWITNLALLFGAELDAEMERGREVQSGIPAEEEIQLPPRDTRKSEKDDRKEQADIQHGRRLRLRYQRRR